jgi:hypothetical protein
MDHDLAPLIDRDFPSRAFRLTLRPVNGCYPLVVRAPNRPTFRVRNDMLILLAIASLHLA